MRIGARGINGTISLQSETFHWTTTSAAVPYLNSSRENGNLEASLRARGQGTVGEQQTISGYEGESVTSASSLRMDADGWEAKGSATVALSAGCMFDLAVVQQEEEEGVQTGTKNQGGGSVRGDQNSVNVSARTVKVEVNMPPFGVRVLFPCPLLPHSRAFYSIREALFPGNGKKQETFVSAPQRT